jgi:[ribosomal protein S18]-alanine N-acetyltransferase
MSGVALENGGAADLARIMPVMASAFDAGFGEAWTEAQCFGVVSMPGSHLVLASDPGVVGFALGRVVVDECELMLLAVTPQSRRAGIGRALLDAVIAGARAAHAASVFLEMREGNPAIGLYSAAGFGEVGRRRNYYHGLSGETFDALTYRLALL